ncbi:MAG: glycosyltransferase family 39 protein [Verrucomicrobiota bacterium]
MVSPSAIASPSSHRPAFIVIGLVLVFRLIYAALIPESPAGDEAYYWDWGRQLDYGYYSKPPFIAWLYAFVDWAGHGSLFAIRAASALFAALSLSLLYLLATAMYDRVTGWAALLIGVAIPANSVLGFFLTIDAPLVACWSTALLAFWNYVDGKRRAASLVLLFVALGIGYLSKQMMMLFPAFAIGFLLLSRETRPLLKKGPLWLVLFGSFVSLAPPLIWNARNEWITFKHTQHHFQKGTQVENVILERLEDFASFVGSQLGALSPIIGLTLFCVCLYGLKFIRKGNLRERFLLTFGALPLLGMLILALRQQLEANWPAVFYMASIVLTAGFYTGRVSFAFPPQKWRNWLKPGLIFGFALSLFFYFGSFAFEAIGMAANKADPNRRMMGHATMAAEFQKIRSAQSEGEDLFLIATGHRDNASHLAFALPDQPRVYLYNPWERINSQYDLWSKPEDDGLVGEDALILLRNSDSLPGSFIDAFDTVSKVGEYQVDYGADRVIPYFVYRGKGYKNWPKSSPYRSP